MYDANGRLMDIAGSAQWEVLEGGNPINQLVDGMNYCPFDLRAHAVPTDITKCLADDYKIKLGANIGSFSDTAEIYKVNIQELYKLDLAPVNDF